VLAILKLYQPIQRGNVIAMNQRLRMLLIRLYRWTNRQPPQSGWQVCKRNPALKDH
jgi:hypothetical protein